MHKKEKIALLADALDPFCDTSAFYHPRFGKISPRADKAGEYKLVPALQHDILECVEDFIEELSDNYVGKTLRKIIHNPQALARIEKIMMDSPNIKKQWQKFKHLWLCERAREFLNDIK